MDIYIGTFIAKHASYILIDGETYSWYELEYLDRNLQLQNLNSDEGSITFHHQSMNTNGLIDTKLLIYTIKWLLNQINHHEEVLWKIKKKKKWSLYINILSKKWFCKKRDWCHWNKAKSVAFRLFIVRIFQLKKGGLHSLLLSLPLYVE